MGSEIEVLAGILALAKEPDKYADVAVYNQAAQYTHHQRPKANKVCVVKRQWQRDPADKKKASEKLWKLFQCRGCISVVITECEKIVPIAFYRRQYDVGQRRHKKNGNHPERMPVIVKCTWKQNEEKPKRKKRQKKNDFVKRVHGVYLYF